MKIAFVYPDIQPRFRFWRGYYYCGIGSLSAYLKQYGHDTLLIHMIRNPSKEKFINCLREEKPDLIGFSCTSHAFPVVEKLAGWIKEENKRLLVICGGIHPTVSPDETIDTEGIDMICRGEGEEPLLELCNKLDKGENIHNILNIWSKFEGEVHRNPLRPPYQDLDRLPFPDRKIFHYRDLFIESQGYATVMVSRGCPYECSYCCNHVLKELYGKGTKYTRFRSVDNAISEIKHIVKEFPFIRGIHFDDDILILNKRWGEAFMARYRDEGGLPFSCNGRPNLLDKETVELMSKAGCQEVSIGLESGNDYIRNEVLKRKLSRKQIIDAFGLCKKFGIHIKSFNMVGIPHEDTRAVLDTIKLNAEVDVNAIQATIFQPYKGTTLFDLCAKRQFLAAGGLSMDFFSEAPLILDSIKLQQILMFRNYFKIFVAFYKLLGKLPGCISPLFINSADRILSSFYTAVVLNKIYVPMNFFFRLFQLRKIRLRKKSF
ncbi:MAG: cobalamin-dependent protein [Candidatus Aminicenantes bacterium]|nr:MAG: cobalamin-dependent protein [Candidatus Aminicenantes bacterium]